MANNELIMVPTGAALNELAKFDGTRWNLTTLSAFLDAVLGATQGLLLRRGVSSWEAIALGASNALLRSDGSLPNYAALSTVIDDAFGSTRGMILRRGASAWQALAIGSANNVLRSDGTDPGYASLTALIDAVFGSTQGSILYRDAAQWAALGPGTSGQFLKTLGAGANPAWAAAGAGKVKQIVATVFTGVATGTTTTQFDNTIPQNTEGDEYMTQAITPTSATNRLLIISVAMLAIDTAQFVSVALFQDSTANALAAITDTIGSANWVMPSVLMHDMVAGTTSGTTFKIRAGRDASGTLTFNGRAGANLYGAITKSSMVVIEYEP